MKSQQISDALLNHRGFINHQNLFSDSVEAEEPEGGPGLSGIVLND